MHVSTLGRAGSTPATSSGRRGREARSRFEQQLARAPTPPPRRHCRQPSDLWRVSSPRRHRSDAAVQAQVLRRRKRPEQAVSALFWIVQALDFPAPAPGRRRHADARRPARTAAARTPRRFTLALTGCSACLVSSRCRIVLQERPRGGFGWREALPLDIVEQMIGTRFGTVARAGRCWPPVCSLSPRRRAELTLFSDDDGTLMLLTPSLSARRASRAASLVADMAHITTTTVWVGGLAALTFTLVWAGAERSSFTSPPVPRFRCSRRLGLTAHRQRHRQRLPAARRSTAVGDDLWPAAPAEAVGLVLRCSRSVYNDRPFSTTAGRRLASRPAGHASAPAARWRLIRHDRQRDHMLVGPGAGAGRHRRARSRLRLRSRASSTSSSIQRQRPATRSTYVDDQAGQPEDVERAAVARSR